MSHPDRILRQYIAEALDPPRWEEVSESLSRSPALRERLALLVATTVPEPAQRWLLPPPGVRAPSVLLGRSALGAVMDADRADWVELSIEVPADKLDHVVVVLERTGEGWVVLAPTSAAEITVAADLPQVGSERRIDVTPGPGVTRVAVALLPGAPDFTAADPWKAVRELVAHGALSAVTFAVGDDTDD